MMGELSDQVAARGCGGERELELKDLVLVEEAACLS